MSFSFFELTSEKMSEDKRTSYRRSLRREEALRVRQERVISGYVKHKHPEIYAYAIEFYDRLDNLYPDKKDLRTTNEYEMLKDSRLRKIRKYRIQKVSEPEGITDKPEEITDKPRSMVLRIPLMDMDIDKNQNTTQAIEIQATETQATETQATETPPVDADGKNQNTTQAIEIQATETQATETPPVDADETRADVGENQVIEIPTVAELPLMDSELFEKVIEDLREDPTIANFFDCFDYEMDDCPLW